MRNKICTGEYELFNTFDSSQIISRAECEVLTPGLSITMAMVVGKYDSIDSDRCPRAGCKSKDFIIKEGDTKMWYALYVVRPLLIWRLVS